MGIDGGTMGGFGSHGGAKGGEVDGNRRTELDMMGRSESREGWRAISTSSDVRLWWWRDIWGGSSKWDCERGED